MNKNELVSEAQGLAKEIMSDSGYSEFLRRINVKIVDGALNFKIPANDKESEMVARFEKDLENREFLDNFLKMKSEEVEERFEKMSFFDKWFTESAHLDSSVDSSYFWLVVSGLLVSFLNVFVGFVYVLLMMFYLKMMLNAVAVRGSVDIDRLTQHRKKINRRLFLESVMIALLAVCLFLF